MPASSICFRCPLPIQNHVRLHFQRCLSQSMQWFRRPMHFRRSAPPPAVQAAPQFDNFRPALRVSQALARVQLLKDPPNYVRASSDAHDKMLHPLSSTCGPTTTSSRACFTQKPTRTRHLEAKFDPHGDAQTNSKLLFTEGRTLYKDCVSNVLWHDAHKRRKVISRERLQFCTPEPTKSNAASLERRTPANSYTENPCAPTLELNAYNQIAFTSTFGRTSKLKPNPPCTG